MSDNIFGNFFGGYATSRKTEGFSRWGAEQLAFV
jgi:hypothetical protein